MIKSLSELGRNMLSARSSTGKSVSSQLVEIVRLRWAPLSRLSPSEYFDFGLYDDQSYSFEQKSEFIGWRMLRPIDRVANSRAWDVFTIDKIVFYGWLGAIGLATPRVYAVYEKRPRHCGDIPVIVTPEALVEFLRVKARYPLFVKPVRGIYGRGAHLLKGYQRTTDALVFADGSRTTPAEFAAGVGKVSSSEGEGFQGLLLQEAVRPHDVLRQVCGERICGLRVCSVWESEPRIWRALLKIPTGQNITDNFEHGRSGNLLARVNVDTGRVERVSGGVGFEHRHFKRHPRTDQSFDGLIVPYWQEVKRACKLAAASLPGTRLLAFDVAVTVEGPVFFEVNIPGDVDLLQIGDGSGVLREPAIRRLAETATRRAGKHWALPRGNR